MYSVMYAALSWTTGVTRYQFKCLGSNIYSVGYSGKDTQSSIAIRKQAFVSIKNSNV